MLKKLENLWLRFTLGLKQRIEQLEKDESGMATVEMVILIVVAVLIVGLVVNFLTKEGFELSNGDKGGLIQWLFDKIKTSLTGTVDSVK
ncbi:MAG: hypothetical protein J6Y20_04195 [Lachnospiraceae bacterium]|nr:hypothetical protein [Lachnospiraceae bacterium]